MTMNLKCEFCGIMRDIGKLTYVRVDGGLRFACCECDEKQREEQRRRDDYVEHVIETANVKA